MSQPATSEWLQEQLSTLLASPYIHFNQPNFPGLHLRMGPGPIDVFSTRFANTFTKEAKGTVGGKEVDKEGLKQSLLALQKKWNKDTAKFVEAQPNDAVHNVSITAVYLLHFVLSRPLGGDEVQLDTERSRYGGGGVCVCNVSSGNAMVCLLRCSRPIFPASKRKEVRRELTN